MSLTQKSSEAAAVAADALLEGRVDVTDVDSWLRDSGVSERQLKKAAVEAHRQAFGTEFVVMTAAAQMPSSCRGRYGRVALVEVVRRWTPRMISTRALGVVRIVETWERLHRGWNDGDNTAFSRALQEARERAAELNRITNFGFVESQRLHMGCAGLR